jgi:hypothetical protein
MNCTGRAARARPPARRLGVNAPCLTQEPAEGDQDSTDIFWPAVENKKKTRNCSIICDSSCGPEASSTPEMVSKWSKTRPDEWNYP